MMNINFRGKFEANANSFVEVEVYFSEYTCISLVCVLVHLCCSSNHRVMYGGLRVQDFSVLLVLNVWLLCHHV